MKMKKFIAGFSAMAIASAMSLTAFAEEVPTETRIDQTSVSKAGDMTATYSVEPSYSVTIPPAAVIADSEDAAQAQQIKAENVLLGDGEKLVVTLTGASNTTEKNAAKFNAKNGESTVLYSIKAGETAVTLGGEVAKFESKAEEQTVDVKFIKDSTSTPTAAGDHTETLTFTISVEEAVTATPLDTTTTAWTAGAFAVPTGGLTYNNSVNVSGDVTLVLTEGETLTLNKGISIADGATLTVQGKGTLIANGEKGDDCTWGGEGQAYAGGGTDAIRGNGTMIVNSGTVTATGGNGGNALASNCYNYGGDGGHGIGCALTVNGGNVTGIGGNGGAAWDETFDSWGGANGNGFNGTVTLGAGITLYNGTDNTGSVIASDEKKQNMHAE